MTLDELNTAPRDLAERELAACCGSSRWASEMAAHRPFGSLENVYRATDEVWWSLGPADWLEAFAKHPRIGERAMGWAQDEQAGARNAPAETMRRLAELNRDYDDKFGYVFLICATGLSADTILASLERRMHNDADTELRVAAGEQARITRLRLDKLLRTPHASRTGG